LQPELLRRSRKDIVQHSHNMNPLVNLAKSAVENYVKGRKIISPAENLPKEFPRSEFTELLTKKSGAFVTIEKEEKLKGLPRDKRKRILRGCIGTYLPTKENIAEEIISNAIAAATEDYRFGPIKKEEFPKLSYIVYILNKPEIVTGVQDPTKLSEEKFRQAGLDPKKYGIIVKTVSIYALGTNVMFNGHTPLKSGLLLPDIESIDTVEQQISIACRKGGIDPIREKIIIYKFTVEKYN